MSTNSTAPPQDSPDSPAPAGAHPSGSHGHGPHQTSFLALTLGALGVVYGDIGTSPLYTIRECVHASGGHKVSTEDLFGFLSLVFWSLTLVVTVKYLVFIMRADNKGEGGIFSLLALLPESRRAPARGRIPFVSLLTIAGAALLFGDGIITPAISVLGAVEGLAVADPDLAPWLVTIACVILVGLFAIQSHGTGTVGAFFGPVMLVWFAVLAILGAYHLWQRPEVVWAFSPHYALAYFEHHGFAGLKILASVFLAVTGGEALYADMGHFGMKPIRVAWLYLVGPALILNYLGQGSLVLRQPDAATNPFFRMVPAGLPMYLLVGISSMAAVIASQALISGCFSLSRQAMQLGFFPRVDIRHTAHHTEGQIYIPQVNYFLAVGCIVLVLLFRSSTNLAAAYGIAVTGTMAITSIMFYQVTRERWKWSVAKALPLFVAFFAMDLLFLGANLTKFFHGGYFPILIGVALSGVMILWARGRTLIAERYALRFPTAGIAMERLNRRLSARVPGTAVFMASNPVNVPPVMVQHVERSRALHENVIVVTVQTMPAPVVAEPERYTVSDDVNGFKRVVMRFGFMEEPNVIPVLEEAGRRGQIDYEPREVTYYLGRESFVASSRGRMGQLEESAFAFLQRNAVPADRSFGLPHRQVIEIGTQMDL